jgi:hypothetical protein
MKPAFLRPNAPLSWLTAAAASLILVAGCSAAPTPGAEPQNAASPAAAVSAAGTAGAVLDKLGVSGLDAMQVVDALDQKSGERQRDVLASVRYDTLVLKDGDREASLKIPDGRFYLSVAPYVAQTHECFYHSLTTCKGELADQSVDVTITDSAGKTLVDGPVTTYSNGFVGFWLPRDIAGTITVKYDGRTATSPISTGKDAPTCLTTLQLT